MALAIPSFDGVSDDIIEIILARLPVASLLSVRQVCKTWCRITRSSKFASFYDGLNSRKSWLFVYCINFLCPYKNQGYGYDPESKQWYLISPRCLPSNQRTAIAASPDGSLCTVFTLNGIMYNREFLSNAWEHTPPMTYCRDSPLLGLVEDCSSKSHKLIVAGGVSFSEEDELAVEVYDATSRSWELCQSLPVNFRCNCSWHWMTSAVVGRKFYVAEIYSGAFAAFDLDAKSWSVVRTLRPSRLSHSHLLSCQGQLLLAGLSYAEDVHTFRLWKVDEATMECGSEIGSMPSELFDSFHSSEDTKGERIQCAASGGLIYVFCRVYSREQSRDNHVVVCDLTNDSCEWTLLPPLPSTEEFNYGYGFSSFVRLESFGLLKE